LDWTERGQPTAKLRSCSLDDRIAGLSDPRDREELMEAEPSLHFGLPEIIAVEISHRAVRSLNQTTLSGCWAVVLLTMPSRESGIAMGAVVSGSMTKISADLCHWPICPRPSSSLDTLYALMPLSPLAQAMTEQL
jgi:hypothetical protein